MSMKDAKPKRKRAAGKRVQIRVRPGAHDVVHACNRKWVSGRVYDLTASDARKVLAASNVLETVGS